MRGKLWVLLWVVAASAAVLFALPYQSPEEVEANALLHFEKQPTRHSKHHHKQAHDLESVVGKAESSVNRLDGLLTSATSYEHHATQMLWKALSPVLRSHQPIVKGLPEHLNLAWWIPAGQIGVALESFFDITSCGAGRAPHHPPNLGENKHVVSPESNCEIDTWTWKSQVSGVLFENSNIKQTPTDSLEFLVHQQIHKLVYDWSPGEESTTCPQPEDYGGQNERVVEACHYVRAYLLRKNVLITPASIKRAGELWPESTATITKDKFKQMLTNEIHTRETIRCGGHRFVPPFHSWQSKPLAVLLDVIFELFTLNRFGNSCERTDEMSRCEWSMAFSLLLAEFDRRAEDESGPLISNPNDALSCAIPKSWSTGRLFGTFATPTNEGFREYELNLHGFRMVLKSVELAKLFAAPSGKFDLEVIAPSTTGLDKHSKHIGSEAYELAIWKRMAQQTKQSISEVELKALRVSPDQLREYITLATRGDVCFKPAELFAKRTLTSLSVNSETGGQVAIGDKLDPFSFQAFRQSLLGYPELFEGATHQDIELGAQVLAQRLHGLGDSIEFVSSTSSTPWVWDNSLDQNALLFLFKCVEQWTTLVPPERGTPPGGIQQDDWKDVYSRVSTHPKQMYISYFQLFHANPPVNGLKPTDRNYRFSDYAEQFCTWPMQAEPEPDICPEVSQEVREAHHVDLVSHSPEYIQCNSLVMTRAKQGKCHLKCKPGYRPKITEHSFSSVDISSLQAGRDGLMQFPEAECEVIDGVLDYWTGVTSKIKTQKLARMLECEKLPVCPPLLIPGIRIDAIEIASVQSHNFYATGRSVHGDDESMIVVDGAEKFVRNRLTLEMNAHVEIKCIEGYRPTIHKLEPSFSARIQAQIMQETFQASTLRLQAAIFASGCRNCEVTGQISLDVHIEARAALVSVTVAYPLKIFCVEMVDPNTKRLVSVYVMRGILMDDSKTEIIIQLFDGTGHAVTRYWWWFSEKNIRMRKSTKTIEIESTEWCQPIYCAPPAQLVVRYVETFDFRNANTQCDTREHLIQSCRFGLTYCYEEMMCDAVDVREEDLVWVRYRDHHRPVCGVQCQKGHYMSGTLALAEKDPEPLVRISVCRVDANLDAQYILATSEEDELTWTCTEATCAHVLEYCKSPKAKKSVCQEIDAFDFDGRKLKPLWTTGRGPVSLATCPKSTVSGFTWHTYRWEQDNKICEDRFFKYESLVSLSGVYGCQLECVENSKPVSAVHAFVRCLPSYSFPFAELVEFPPRSGRSFRCDARRCPKVRVPPHALAPAPGVCGTRTTSSLAATAKSVGSLALPVTSGFQKPLDPSGYQAPTPTSLFWDGAVDPVTDLKEPELGAERVPTCQLQCEHGYVGVELSGSTRCEQTGRECHHELLKESQIAHTRIQRDVTKYTKPSTCQAASGGQVAYVRGGEIVDHSKFRCIYQPCLLAPLVLEYHEHYMWKESSTCFFTNGGSASLYQGEDSWSLREDLDRLVSHHCDFTTDNIFCRAYDPHPVQMTGLPRKTQACTLTCRCWFHLPYSRTFPCKPVENNAEFPKLSVESCGLDETYEVRDFKVVLAGGKSKVQWKADCKDGVCENIKYVLSKSGVETQTDLHWVGDVDAVKGTKIYEFAFDYDVLKPVVHIQIQGKVGNRQYLDEAAVCEKHYDHRTCCLRYPTTWHNQPVDEGFSCPRQTGFVSDQSRLLLVCHLNDFAAYLNGVYQCQDLGEQRAHGRYAYYQIDPHSYYKHKKVLAPYDNYLQYLREKLGELGVDGAEYKVQIEPAPGNTHALPPPTSSRALLALANNLWVPFPPDTNFAEPDTHRTPERSGPGLVYSVKQQSSPFRWVVGARYSESWGPNHVATPKVPILDRFKESFINTDTLCTGVACNAAPLKSKFKSQGLFATKPDSMVFEPCTSADGVCSIDRQPGTNDFAQLYTSAALTSEATSCKPCVETVINIQRRSGCITSLCPSKTSYCNENRCFFADGQTQGPLLEDIMVTLPTTMVRGWYKMPCPAPSASTITRTGHVYFYCSKATNEFHDSVFDTCKDLEQLCPDEQLKVSVHQQTFQGYRGKPFFLAFYGNTEQTQRHCYSLAPATITSELTPWMQPCRFGGNVNIECKRPHWQLQSTCAPWPPENCLLKDHLHHASVGVLDREYTTFTYGNHFGAELGAGIGLEDPSIKPRLYMELERCNKQAPTDNIKLNLPNVPQVATGVEETLLNYMDDSLAVSCTKTCDGTVHYSHAINSKSLRKLGVPTTGRNRKLSIQMDVIQYDFRLQCDRTPYAKLNEHCHTTTNYETQWCSVSTTQSSEDRHLTRQQLDQKTTCRLKCDTIQFDVMWARAMTLKPIGRSRKGAFLDSDHSEAIGPKEACFFETIENSANYIGQTLRLPCPRPFSGFYFAQCNALTGKWWINNKCRGCPQIGSHTHIEVITAGEYAWARSCIHQSLVTDHLSDVYGSRDLCKTSRPRKLEAYAYMQSNTFKCSDFGSEYAGTFELTCGQTMEDPVGQVTPLTGRFLVDNNCCLKCNFGLMESIVRYVRGNPRGLNEFYSVVGEGDWTENLDYMANIFKKAASRCEPIELTCQNWATLQGHSGAFKSEYPVWLICDRGSLKWIGTAWCKRVCSLSTVPDTVRPGSCPQVSGQQERITVPKPLKTIPGAQVYSISEGEVVETRCPSNRVGFIEWSCPARPASGTACAQLTPKSPWSALLGCAVVQVTSEQLTRNVLAASTASQAVGAHYCIPPVQCCQVEVHRLFVEATGDLCASEEAQSLSAKLLPYLLTSAPVPDSLKPYAPGKVLVPKPSNDCEQKITCPQMLSKIELVTESQELCTEPTHNPALCDKVCRGLFASDPPSFCCFKDDQWELSLLDTACKPKCPLSPTPTPTPSIPYSGACRTSDCTAHCLHPANDQTRGQGSEQVCHLVSSEVYFYRRKSELRTGGARALGLVAKDFIARKSFSTFIGGDPVFGFALQDELFRTETIAERLTHGAEKDQPAALQACSNACHARATRVAFVDTKFDLVIGNQRKGDTGTLTGRYTSKFIVSPGPLSSEPLLHPFSQVGGLHVDIVRGLAHPNCPGVVSLRLCISDGRSYFLTHTGGKFGVGEILESDYKTSQDLVPYTWVLEYVTPDPPPLRDTYTYTTRPAPRLLFKIRQFSSVDNLGTEGKYVTMQSVGDTKSVILDPPVGKSATKSQVFTFVSGKEPEIFQEWLQPQTYDVLTNRLALQQLCRSCSGYFCKLFEKTGMCQVPPKPKPSSGDFPVFLDPKTAKAAAQQSDACKRDCLKNLWCRAVSISSTGECIFHDEYPTNVLKGAGDCFVKWEMLQATGEQMSGDESIATRFDRVVPGACPVM